MVLVFLEVETLMHFEYMPKCNLRHVKKDQEIFFTLANFCSNENRMSSANKKQFTVFL